MPKLPDMEYAVVSQGPPNALQAFGAAAQAIGTLDDVTRDAAKAFAEELAKTQVSEASLRVEAGLGDLENTLKTKPYLSRREVLGALGGNVPADVRALVDAAPDDDAPAIETWRVGGAMHRAAAQRLAADAAPTIIAPRVRQSFEQRAAADAMQRGLRFEQEMAQAGAELNAAKTLALADARARVAVTPADWARVSADIVSSGWLSPAQKEKALAHYAGLQATQGKQREAAGLAEGALAAGRDGASPWIDAGKAQAAFEASVAGQDPLVAEDARQRFTQSLAQNNAARQASDAPLLGRLETRLYQGGGLSRLSDDYKALSPVGQAHIEKLAAAERRLSRSASNEDRRAQADLDAAALVRFKSLDLRDQVAFDPRKDDLGEKLGNTDFGSVSLKGRDAITVEWKKAQDAWKKDQGVSEQDFMRESDDLAVRLGLKKKGQRTEKSELFDAYMRTQYRDWRERQPEDGPKKPSVEETRAMFRSAIEYGDKGGLHLSGNKFRFQAKPGEEFVPFGPDEQKGHKVLDAGKPAAARRVQGAEIGQPGGLWEEQANGKWKRVE